MPLLLVPGGHLTIEHAALTGDLLGDAALDVVPASTHPGLMHRAVVEQLLEDFLAR